MGHVTTTAAPLFSLRFSYSFMFLCTLVTVVYIVFKLL